MLTGNIPESKKVTLVNEDGSERGEIMVIRPDPRVLEDIRKKLLAERGIEQPLVPMGKHGAPLPPGHRRMTKYQRDLNEYNQYVEEVNADSALLASVLVDVPEGWKPKERAIDAALRERYGLPPIKPLGEGVLARTAAYIRELMQEPTTSDAIADAIDVVTGQDVDEMGRTRREALEESTRASFQNDVAGQAPAGRVHSDGGTVGGDGSAGG
jgi:hypothetical protein